MSDIELGSPNTADRGSRPRNQQPPRTPGTDGPRTYGDGPRTYGNGPNTVSSPNGRRASTRHSNRSSSQHMSMSKKVPPIRMWASLIHYTTTVNQQLRINEALDKISALPAVFAYAGLHELYLKSLYRALLVEYVGMAAFVYFHIGIVAASTTYTYPPLVSGIGHAFLLTLFIYQFASISGAHFNSLITIASIITGHIPFVRGLMYIMVQIFGSMSGAYIMFKSIEKGTSESLSLATCQTGPLSTYQALAIEFFFSMGFLFVIYGMAFNLRQREIFGPVLPPIFIGITLGLIIFASASLAASPFTGAGVNPPLCLGTAWAYHQTNLDGNSKILDDQWVYWVGAIIASCVNAAIYQTAPPFHEMVFADENKELLNDEEEQLAEDEAVYYENNPSARASADLRAQQSTEAKEVKLESIPEESQPAKSV